MVRITLVFFLSLLLGACAIAAGDRAAVFGATRVTADSRTGWVNAYWPPVTRIGNRSSDAVWQTWLIRTRLDRGAAGRGKPFQLYVRAMFPKRVYLRQAYAGGRPLDTIVIDRERTRAGTLETVGINLTQAEAQGYAGAGLSLRIVGRRASVLVEVPMSRRCWIAIGPRRVNGVMPIRRRPRSDARQGGIRRAARRSSWRA